MSIDDEPPPAVPDTQRRSINHDLQILPAEHWLPVISQKCSFDPDAFEAVSVNLLRNPNINSSLLFRADVLYDSKNEVANAELSKQERESALQEYNLNGAEAPGFQVERTILRRMIPRNPQLDKPILQTCVFCRSVREEAEQYHLVVYIPHTASVDGMPWYHPRVQSLAYLHSWSPQTSSGSVSLYYRLFPSENLPLSNRLERTAHHLLATIIKHGNGRMTGYQKRVHHDQLVSQQRVQDTYSKLKERHAKRLCDNWVEKTEPSKHVFEDLGIAAFLIELWRDMYAAPADSNKTITPGEKSKPKFPGFVDIGCGNGVLVDILLREGFSGWGFDARKRKTWATFTSSTQKCLKELILIPEPLQDSTSIDLPAPSTPKHRKRWSLTSFLPTSKAPYSSASSSSNPQPTRSSSSSHNGIFPPHTFLISNHADELTPWTPLLASLSASPFLCIPCCSHNLSGQRFRAPSVFNDKSADAFAPSYFAPCVNRSKAVALKIAPSDCEDLYAPHHDNNDDDNEDASVHAGNGEAASKAAPAAAASSPETGDLKKMCEQRKSNKQQSAYSSLCDWVAYLCGQVGYEVEREVLRMPSTRNVGIVCRSWKGGVVLVKEEEGESEMAGRNRRERVDEIVRREKADGEVWVQRAVGLMKGQQGNGH